MATFYLVRHAHAVYVPSEQRGLSPAGLGAAQTLSAFLQTSDIAVIYSSPYMRAVQTIRPLAHALALPIHLDLDLRERRLARNPVDDFALAVRASWQSPDISLPGGESNRDAQVRGLQVLQQLASKTGDILLSTHGTLLALMLNGLDPRYGYDFWHQLRMPDAFRLNVHIDHQGELRLVNLERLHW